MSERKTFVCVKTDGEDFTLGDTITGYLIMRCGELIIDDVKPLKVADREMRDFIISDFYSWYPLVGQLWGWKEVE